MHRPDCAVALNCVLSFWLLNASTYRSNSICVVKLRNYNLTLINIKGHTKSQLCLYVQGKLLHCSGQVLSSTFYTSLYEQRTWGIAGLYGQGCQFVFVS